MVSDESPFEDRSHCPVCAATGNVIYRQRFDSDPIRSYLERFYGPQGSFDIDQLGDAEYVLIECPRCALIYQRFVPSLALSHTLYEEWLDPMSAALIDSPTRNARYFKQVAQDALVLLAHLPPDTERPAILDFGMGDGDWARTMGALGCDAFGFDISRTRMDAASRFGVTPIAYDEIPTQGFAIINADQVFEHLADPVGTLRHLASALTPDGLISIRVPKAANIRTAIVNRDWSAPKGSKHSLNPVAPLEHINCFTHASLERLGTEAGLVERRIGLGRQYANTIGWRANPALIRQLAAPVYRSLTHRSAWILLTHPRGRCINRTAPVPARAGLLPGD